LGGVTWTAAPLLILPSIERRWMVRGGSGVLGTEEVAVNITCRVGRKTGAATNSAEESRKR